MTIGNVKLFVPRVPVNCYLKDGYIVEDTITPRVCLAPTILGCVIATHFGDDHTEVNLQHMFQITVFATDDIPNMFVPKQIKKKIPPNYKGIVPDCDVTHEIWSLDPIELTVIYKFDWTKGDVEEHNELIFSIWKDEYNSYMPRKYKI